MKEYSYDIETHSIDAQESRYIIGQLQLLNNDIKQIRHMQDDINNEIKELNDDIDKLKEYIKLPWYKKIRKKPPV